MAGPRQRREPGRFTRSITASRPCTACAGATSRERARNSSWWPRLQGRGTRPPNWGEGQGVRVLVYDVPDDPASQPWPVEVADETLHTIHNLQLVDVDGDRRDEIVLACWEGVFLLDRSETGKWVQDPARLGQPAIGTEQGSQRGEGRLARIGLSLHRHDRALAWLPGCRLHPRRDVLSGARVLLERGEANRQVVAEPLQWGHAVWCANLDQDKDDELIIGQRDPNSRGNTAVPAGPAFLSSIPGRERILPSSTASPSTTAAWPARMPWPPTSTAMAATTSSPAAGPPTMSRSTGIARGKQAAVAVSSAPPEQPKRVIAVIDRCPPRKVKFARHESHRDHRSRRARGSGDPRGPDARATGRPDPGAGAGLRPEPGRPVADPRPLPGAAGVPADIPGLEYAGEVDALGPDVTGPLKVGDRVFGIVAGGAQAEYLVTHERMAVPIPANLDFVEAAAVPEVFLTAHDALITQGRLGPGEPVLIQAVGSGVGTAAAQIAHAMGCTVFGTSRTAAKLEQARSLGLDVPSTLRSRLRRRSFASKRPAQGFRSCSTCWERECSAGNLKALATRGRLVAGRPAGRTRGTARLSGCS